MFKFIGEQKEKKIIKFFTEFNLKHSEKSSNNGKTLKDML